MRRAATPRRRAAERAARWPSSPRRGEAQAARRRRAQGDKAGGAMALLAALERSPFIAEAESNLRVLLNAPAVVKEIAAQDPAAGAEAALFRAFFAGQKAQPDVAPDVVKNAPRLYLG